MHMLNATYMALRNYSDIYILCIIVYTCDKSVSQSVITTPHTDANSIQKDNHQLSTQFKKTKRGPAFRAK